MIDDRERRLLDRLPAEPRERLLRMVHERDSLSAGSREAGHRRNQLRDEIEAEKRFLDQRTKEGHIADDDSSVRMAREAIRFKTQELGDLDRANADREVRRQPLTSLIRRALEVVAGVPASKVLRPANPERPNLKGGHLDAVARLRSRISALKVRRTAVAGAPLPVALLKEAAREQIEALAERGRPDLVIGEGLSIEWPKSSQMAGGTPEDAMLSVCAFLHRDAMVAAVHAQIDQEASDEGALTPADRAAALKKVEGEIEAAERTEAALIDDARDNGVIIEYRADADPFAVLGLSREFVDAPAKAAALYKSQAGRQPRTSPAPVHGSSLPEPALRGSV